MIGRGGMGNVSRIDLPTGKELVRGLAVSADERWILYSQIDRWVSHNLLVEGFR